MHEWECTFIQVSYAGFVEKLVVREVVFSIELHYKTENLFMWRNFQ